jgi:hypothetical protein
LDGFMLGSTTRPPGLLSNLGEHQSQLR